MRRTSQRNFRYALMFVTTLTSFSSLHAENSTFSHDLENAFNSRMKHGSSLCSLKVPEDFKGVSAIAPYPALKPLPLLRDEAPLDPEWSEWAFGATEEIRAVVLPSEPQLAQLYKAFVEPNKEKRVASLLSQSQIEPENLIHLLRMMTSSSNAEGYVGIAEAILDNLMHRYAELDDNMQDQVSRLTYNLSRNPHYYPLVDKIINTLITDASHFQEADAYMRSLLRLVQAYAYLDEVESMAPRAEKIGLHLIQYGDIHHVFPSLLQSQNIGKYPHLFAGFVKAVWESDCPRSIESLFNWQTYNFSAAQLAEEKNKARLLRRGAVNSLERRASMELPEDYFTSVLKRDPLLAYEGFYALRADLTEAQTSLYKKTALTPKEHETALKSLANIPAHLNLLLEELDLNEADLQVIAIELQNAAKYLTSNKETLVKDPLSLQEGDQPNLVAEFVQAKERHMPEAQRYALVNWKLTTVYPAAVRHLLNYGASQGFMKPTPAAGD